MHPFRQLREQENSNAADCSKILAEDIVFHTPVLAYALKGRDINSIVFAATPAVKKETFVGEWKLDDRTSFLYWRGEIQGHELESMEIIKDNDEGLIVERSVAYRPMLAPRLFRDTMYPRMKDKFPPDIWEDPDTDRKG